MVKYSIVIPVYNSEAVVGKTIAECVDYLDSAELEYELILIDDGSCDSSWSVLKSKFQAYTNITIIRLLRNYGQHTAILCGLANSSGEYVITLDDDLQNPPREIEKLISKSKLGHDLVFARFEQKRHSIVRRVGSRVINWINTRVFQKPPELVLTNFRLIRRSVVERMLTHITNYPYINGLAVMYAESPADVLVEHRARDVGRSHYTILKIGELVLRILFNYSSFPLRLVSALGFAISVASFALTAYFFLRALLGGIGVPGWASVAVMLSFFNGLSLLLLGMLGEYQVRLLNQVSQTRPYHVTKILRHEG